jgi:hypothetical protein
MQIDSSNNLPKEATMKIPIDVITIWLSIMSDEELIRFRKRLEMNLADMWKREKRESLIDLFSAEIKRRKHSPKHDQI